MEEFIGVTDLQKQDEQSEETLSELICRRDLQKFAEVISRGKDQKEVLEALHIATKLSERDFKSVEPFIKHILESVPNAFLLKDPSQNCVTALDEAIYSKNNELLSLLFTHEKQRYFSTLEGRVNLVHQLLLSQRQESFSFDLSWEVNSSVMPLVQRVLPRDTIRISKWKDQIRIDFSCIQW